MSRQRVLLQGAATVIGDLCDRQPCCLDAAALALETAARLGVEMRPVAVSLVVAHPARGPEFMLLGERALESYRRQGIGQHAACAGALSGEAGHVVLVSDEEHLLLDPTFGQLPDPLGEVACLAVGVRETNPSSEVWQITPPHGAGRVVAYVIKPHDQGEVEDLLGPARAADACQYLADRVADLVREWVDATGGETEPPMLMLDTPKGPRRATLADLYPARPPGMTTSTAGPDDFAYRDSRLAGPSS